MSNMTDQAVVWSEQVGELHLDANQREVIRRLYAEAGPEQVATLLGRPRPRPRPLTVLGCPDDEARVTSPKSRS